MPSPDSVSISASPVPTLPADRRRYPGVRSFEEPDERRFFGRTQSADELLLRVLSVRLLLQFAPSGVGKTSLLNAGLFPKLRQHTCFPFIIRLNRDNETLTQAATRSLRDAALASGLKEPIIPENAENLWALLAGLQLWSHDLLLLTPVLVFDQFEEIFTLRDEAFRKGFAMEVGELLRRRPPSPPAGQSPQASAKESPAPDVKIVISLREEYLGKVEELSASIPDLFRERLRLAPLSATEAKEAIVEPAQLPGDGWLSPPFQFEPGCLDWLIDFIDGTSARVKVIEPLTLQLVCQQAEEIARARAERVKELPKLRPEDFGGLAGLERLVQNYFASELNKLGPGKRKHAREMFDHGLLDPNGKRLMLEQGEIERDYGLDPDTLNALVDSRLLRREPRNESDFYEISHDRLAETIARNRKTKLPRWVRPTIAIGAVLIIAAALFVIYLNRARAQAETAKAHTEEALVLLLGDDLVVRLREAGLSDALQRVLDRVGIDESSKSRALALKLRHQGNILRERGTISEARQKLTESLAVLDAVMARSEGRDFGLMGERAQTLKSLGSLMNDSGEVAKAKVFFAQSVQIWDEILKGTASQEAMLNAAEARITLGALRERMGDRERAESDYIKSLDIARKVLTTASERQSRDGDVFFELGHAMQIYADAALNLASLWSSESDAEEAAAEAEGSVALAREALRLRPLSFQARIQVGAASANSSGAILNASSKFPVELFSQSKRAFDELTQFDSNNLLLQRERAALQVMRSEVVATCAVNPDCKTTLSAGVLEEAEIATLGSIGDFRMLAGNDSENRSLRGDIAWGLETRASLVSVLASPAEALPILDEAIAIRRKCVVDRQDLQNRFSLIDLFHHKARLLDQSGRPREALAAVDESLAEVDRLPATFMVVTWSRINTVDLKIPLLRKLGRNEEAGRLQKARTEMDALADRRSPTRRQRALALNLEGNAFDEHARTLTGATAMEEHRRARERYELATKEYPFDSQFWSNLRDVNKAMVSIANELETSRAGTSSPGSGKSIASKESHAKDLEAALRGALVAAWMASVLSPEATAADSWAQLFEARRALTLHLYFTDDKERKEEALVLGAQGALEAEEYVRQHPDSAVGRLNLADGNIGLSMLRSKSDKAGWEEALRIGIAYLNRDAKLEPPKSEHKIRIGGLRRALGDRLVEAHREEAAAEEYRLALRDCREALRLAKDRDEHEAAQSCLDGLAKLGYK